MTVRPSRLRAYLELARISNLPTLWSNGLVGAAAGAAGSPDLPWPRVAACLIGLSLLYIGGMALNDACDSAIDAAERPSRPVPSGRVSRRAAFVMAAVCLGVGSVPIAVAGSTAAAAGLALVGCIVAYNLLHVRSSAAVVLMGLCRGLACLTAATVAAGSDQESLLPALAPSAAITLHTLGLSLLARDEMADSLIRSALADPIRLFPLIALAPIPTIAAGHHLASTVAASAAYLVWCSVYLLRPLPTVRVVLALISGFCLLDAALLAALGQPDLSIVAAVCFLLTRLGHQRSSGT